MESETSRIQHLKYFLSDLTFQEKPIKPIEIAIINYSNRILIIITQMNKMGNIVACSCESIPEMKEEYDINFDIQTLFGSRDFEEFHELISRGALEIMNNDKFLMKELNEKGVKFDSNKFMNPFKGKNLLLSISLEASKEERNADFEKFLFQKIVLSLKTNIINFFFM